MESGPKLYQTRIIFKGICIACIVSLAAGWLTRELLTGKVDPANKAAAYILDLTLFIMLSILSILGSKRWRNNELSPAAKRILVISVIFLIAFFILGWRSDLSLQ
jgi:uncharacterized membrane protein